MTTREEKIRNAIAFFALEHERLVRRPLAVSFLDRYLSFLDFTSVARLGRPALGILYRTMRRGSIVTGLCEKRDDTKCFVLVPQPGGGHAVKATAAPDLSCFSSFEVDEMKRLVRINAHRAAKAIDAGDDARERTWAEIEEMATHLSREKSRHKPEEVTRMSGLTVLIQRYVKQLEELETRMKDTKHKLETVMEASRLLAEEGPWEEIPAGPANG